ncbi:MAG: nitrile hydratase subunit beta [Rhodospirillales bacterium]|jgi:nitrile hydratase|nr:nitrile hydratase subunit beta [Rhodospirillales bacterium]
MDTAPSPTHHDLGGNPKYRCTAVEPENPALNDFDKRVDALRVVLREKGLITTDEQRLKIESLPPEEYFGLSYYEKWLKAMAAVLVSRGIVSWEDVS